MEKRLPPTLVNVLKDPSVFGGPKTYADIRIKNQYNVKYNKYILKNHTIPFRVYCDQHKSIYLFHFQIVSESDPEVFYDVLIKFFPENQKMTIQDTLDEYQFQVFSNSPGFCFKYAYVYNKGNRLIPSMASKINEIETPPTKTNPTRAFGYDYTLYFAMYFLHLNSQYLTKKELHRIAKPYVSFNRDDILDSYQAYKKRNEKEFDTFERIKKATKRLIKKPQEGLKSVASKLGIVKPKSAIKPMKPKKAVKSTRRNFK